MAVLILTTREGRTLPILLKPVAWLGMVIVTGIANIGEVVCIFLNTLKQLRYVHKNPVLIVKQMISIGVTSLPLLFVTSIFTGMVATVQAKFEFHNLVSDKFV